MGLRYLRWSNLFDWLVYVLSMTFVIPDVLKGSDFRGFRECWQWEMGSVMIALAWMNLLGDIRHMSVFGIYVIMFENIFKSVMKFMLVLLVFVVSVGLGLHMLLIHQDPFENPWFSILKVGVGIVGEYEYEGIFVQEDGRELPFKWTTVILFVTWMILMPIIIVNLLVGLAVDDIKLVQEQAELKKLALQVEMVLEWEKLMPIFLLHRLRCQVESLSAPKRLHWWPEEIMTKRMIFTSILGRKHKVGGDLDIQQNNNNNIKETVKLRKAIQTLSEENAVIKKEMATITEETNAIKNLLITMAKEAKANNQNNQQTSHKDKTKL